MASVGSTSGLESHVLADAEAAVAGASTAAAILRRHLAALGAVVTDPGEAPAEAAALVDLRLSDGRRRELEISWAGPIDEPSLRDEASVQAFCGVMQVNGRRAGSPRGLAVDYCGATAAVLGSTGLLASLMAESARAVTVHSKRAGGYRPRWPHMSYGCSAPR